MRIYLKNNPIRVSAHEAGRHCCIYSLSVTDNRVASSYNASCLCLARELNTLCRARRVWQDDDAAELTYSRAANDYIFNLAYIQDGK